MNQLIPPPAPSREHNREKQDKQSTQNGGEIVTEKPVNQLNDQSTDFAPLNIIRTETVFSKLPIHNLAKKGSVDIQITQKNENGEIQLQWKVTPNLHLDIGQPRQLAYKLDTIIINRKVDELSRPLPELIRLGSLKAIAKELGLGRRTNEVRHALRQNASALITAKLNYKDKQGGRRWIEFEDTRYGLVFFEEELPDGRKANAVYLILHKPYREILNNALVRPLNYDYLKSLPPAPQRFYEIISYRIFAAIKHKNLRATKLLYSDYCTFSAQKRSYDWNFVRSQMYQSPQASHPIRLPQERKV